MVRGLFVLFLTVVSSCALAQTALKVKVFPGAQALPLIAATSQGIFERHGLKVELLFTQNSVELRDDLANGNVQIVHSAVDNAVAMVERAKKDVVIVSGGDSSMNEFFVQPGVTSVADLKGGILLVDAPNTAYAVQAKKILLMSGLKQGTDYSLKEAGGTMFRYKAIREGTGKIGSMLNPPFSVDAAAAGLKSLGRAVDLIGPYQATGAFVLRDWAKANSATLENYLAAVIEGTRWVQKNKEASAKILAERFKLEPKVAERTWELLADPKFGLANDARFNVDGFKNVLALRAEIEGDWGGKPPAAERYYDLSYYDRAIRTVK